MVERIHTDFEYDNNYDTKNNFTRVKYGNNRKILETELNEMQKIQDENRSSLIRKMIPSGFSYLKRSDINGDAIIVNPNDEINTISLAPSKLFLNGYEITIEGNESYADSLNITRDGYLKIVLPDPPNSLSTEHFVFLEAWFEELSIESAIKKFGYEEGEILNNTIADGRVNDETSRRLGLKWRIRIVEDQDFNRWEDGFGYINDTNFSSIYGYGAINKKIDNLNLLFRSATEDVFKDCNFYGDNGLWIAGRPTANDPYNDNSTNNLLGIVENYVFAIPLLKIKRRNTTEYSLNNPNGASIWVDESSISTHPDSLFCNRISVEDVVDLRRSISFDGWNYDQLLNQSLKDLLTGSLQTYKKEVMHRAQFGVEQVLDTDANVVFISRFNGGTKTASGMDPNIIYGDQNPQYGMGSSGQGLVMNGTSSLEYILPVFNSIRGGVDFFFRPFWGSNDTTSAQTIFSILDGSYNTKVFEFKKDGNKLYFNVKRNNSGLAGDTYGTEISLLDTPIFGNKLYHFRITWEYGTSTTTLTGGDRNGSLSIYLNGQLLQVNNYVGTDLNPSLLRIGEVESYNSNEVNVESIIDEFVVYDDLVAGFKQIYEDLAKDMATLYPSFNNSLNSFNDNGYTQNNFVKPVITLNTHTTFDLETFRGSIITNDIPTVYDANGNTYTGTWNNLGTLKATFTLTSSPTSGTTFTGETVYVQHNIKISAGNGAFELPTTILKAELNGVEMSFNETNSEPRLISLYDSTVDKTYEAYDFSTNRTSKDCHARIVYYKITGNGQDRYYVPLTMFGYDVIGISYVSKRYDNIRKLTNDPKGLFEVELTYALLEDQEVEIHVMLGGIVFDYQTYTKSIISNTLKTDVIQITAPGNTEVFKIKLNNSAGYSTFVATGNLLRNTYDTNGIVNGTVNNYIVYKNGQQVELLSASGFGTPFLTIEFANTPLSGEIIEIPVLSTYSLSASDLVSVWFKHVPYQGMLDNLPKNLNKVSNWIPFVTTLSSGNLVINNPSEKSINNAFNRLPGGGSYTYALTGDDINFKGDNFTSYNGLNPNKKFVLNRNSNIIDKNNELDAYFFELDSSFTIKKLQNQFQDGGLDVPFNINGFYMSDTEEQIVKYGGAACLVSDEEGRILLFLFGHTHNFEKTNSTVCLPEFGDLFYLKNNPTILYKK